MVDVSGNRPLQNYSSLYVSALRPRCYPLPHEPVGRFGFGERGGSRDLSQPATDAELDARVVVSHGA